MTEEAKLPNQEKFEAHIELIAKRIEVAKAKFGDMHNSPFRSKKFNGFITDYFSEITTRFILQGEVEIPGRASGENFHPSDLKDEAMRAAGFTVAGVPPVPGAKPAEGTVPVKTDTAKKIIELDPNLARMGSVQMALDEGFDPTVKGPDE